MEMSSSGHQIAPNGNVAGKLETAKSADWNRVMAEDSNCKLVSFIKILLDFVWNWLLSDIHAFMPNSDIVLVPDISVVA